jgi:hypothetical protein
MFFDFLFEDDHKAGITYLLTMVICLILGGFTRLSNNEAIQVSGFLFFTAAICALIALLAVVLSDAATGFVAAGIYAIICVVMAFFVAIVGEPFNFAFVCIGGGISLIVAVPRKKIGFAVTGWVIFALGLYVLQNLL